jgi:hypothetical protein
MPSFFTISIWTLPNIVTMCLFMSKPAVPCAVRTLPLWQQNNKKLTKLLHFLFYAVALLTKISRIVAPNG